MSANASRQQPHTDEATDADWLDRLITEQEAAAFLGVSVRFMQNRRVRGGGPPYVRISGRCIRYRRRDLIAWANDNLEAHTSARPAPTPEMQLASGGATAAGSHGPPVTNEPAPAAELPRATSAPPTTPAKPRSRVGLPFMLRS